MFYYDFFLFTNPTQIHQIGQSNKTSFIQNVCHYKSKKRILEIHFVALKWFFLNT